MNVKPAELRIALVCGSASGGVSVHIRHLAQILTERSFRVVLAGPAEVIAQTAPEVKVLNLDISDRPRLGDFQTLRKLRKLMRRADVVHAHGLRSGALVVLAGIGLRTRIVLTWHNLPVGKGAVALFGKFLSLIGARGADAVLGVSPDLVELARKQGAKHAELALIPAPSPRSPQLSPAADSDVPAKSNVEQDSLAEAKKEVYGVLTVARLAPQKGLDLLCDAAALLTDLPLQWTVLGEGPLREQITRRIDQENLPVVLAGHCPDVLTRFAETDLVVSTSLWEGQPVALQEALSEGAAIVATEVGGTSAVTAAAALLVPPEATALARAIRETLLDPVELARWRKKARIRARELPTVEQELDQLIGLYQKCSANQ